MEKNDELEEIGIKNCMCYYFDDIMRVGDVNFVNISLDENSKKNSHGNILIYDISYETFLSEKPLRKVR